MPKQYKVLIVDDDLSLRDMTKRVLVAKGHEVDQAQDGFEAVKKAEKGIYDLLLMDIRMPQMDGLETFKAIRTIRPDLKVVMMTGYAEEERIQEALEMGARGCLRKPFDILALVEVLSDLEKTS